MNAEGIWIIDSISIAPYDNARNVEKLLHFLLREFCRIFGDETMYSEPCKVINDPNEKNPKFITNQSILIIRLNTLKFNLWSQIIYQLSHELCHYALHQNKRDTDFFLHWFEEIVCEAMSLYMLKYAKDHWRLCEFSKTDPKYVFSLGTYLLNEKKKTGTDRLKQINTIEELKRFNDVCQDSREGHLNQRNELYEVMKTSHGDFRFLQDYSRYIIASENLLVDFAGWKHDYPELDNNAVFNTLEGFQPHL